MCRNLRHRPPSALPMAMAVVVTLGLAGCQGPAAQTIGVVPKGANHIFWQTVHAGAVKAAREHGYQVEWNAPTLEVDASRQIEIVESMVNRRLAGIVLAPVDRKALVSVVERAAREGIPVSIFDSAIDSSQRISYVATNNEEGGRIAARRLGERIGGKGKVAVIGFMPGSASTMEREAGFEDEMRKRFPGVQLLGIRFGMADRARAMSETENLLTAHPDLAGLFADNESSSTGAVQALKSRNARRVALVAFDASDHLVRDCEEGWIDALVVQDPFRMGYESTRAVIQKRRGESVTPVIDSGVRLLLREDLAKPDVRAFLFPDLKEWLGR